MRINRRGFVELSAGLVASAALPGCASVGTTRLTPVGQEVRVHPRDYPQLAGAGGQLRIRLGDDSPPIYLLAGPAGQFTALSPICTHLGCTVNVEGAVLVCPCHGSTYDRTGQVMRGPAERPLRSYPVRVTNDGELVISLEGA